MLHITKAQDGNFIIVDARDQAPTAHFAPTPMAFAKQDLVIRLVERYGVDSEHAELAIKEAEETGTATIVLN